MSRDQKGYRGRPIEKEITRVVGKKGSRRLSEPRPWLKSGASHCTVRIDRKIRDELKHRIRRRGDGSKLKEVDVVNDAIYRWLLKDKAIELSTASHVELEFSSSFELSEAQRILKYYPKHVVMKVRRIKGTSLCLLELWFHRNVIKSKAFMKDLEILVSLNTKFKIIQKRA